MSGLIHTSNDQIRALAKSINAGTVFDKNHIPSSVDVKMTLDLAKEKKELVICEDGSIITCDPVSKNIYPLEQCLKNQFKKTPKTFLSPSSIVQSLRKDLNREDKEKKEQTEAKKNLEKLVEAAVKQNASDIHMNILSDRCSIVFRINGVLVPYTDWTQEQGIRVHQVAYNSTAEDRSDNFNINMPQDVSFTIALSNGKSVRIRSSNIPTYNKGCSIVYRLLSIGDSEILPIKQLGYTAEEEQLLYETRGLSSGLVLVCGETGSGKTTTLASILAGIDHRRHVFSIEDPVEKIIKNVVQVPVDYRNTNKSFVFYLRAILRQDPDVVMVGEIRDEETARVAINSSLTGHLIFSTLHTRFAVDAILRLHELGISNKLLATPHLLKLIVAQELHPILCPTCKRKLKEGEKEKLSILYSREELDVLYTKSERSEVNTLCQHCLGKGIVGRKVFAEIIKIDQKSRDFIINMDIKAWERYLQQQGLVSLRKKVRDNILSGFIDALDVKSFDPIEEETYKYEEEGERCFT